MACPPGSPLEKWFLLSKISISLRIFFSSQQNNQQSTNPQEIEFQTRQSGILKCARAPNKSVEMKLPVNEPNLNFDDPESDPVIWSLVKTVLQSSNGLKPAKVRLSPVTKKLLILLQNGTSRNQLEEIQASIKSK